MRTTLLLLLSMVLISCLKEDELKKSFRGFQPRNIGDGWVVGSSLKNQVDSFALNKVYQSIYDDESTWPLRSVLVFRNGEIIAESYLKDEEDRLKRRAVWSCTKQVMALVVGDLFDKGELFPGDRIEQFIVQYTDRYPDKKDISIEQLLTMKSGINFNNDEDSDVFRKKEKSSSVDYVLGLDLNHQPGSHFNYNDGDPQVLSAVIQSITSMPTDLYADKVLFSKIGFDNYQWHRYPDGITMGGFGILTTPREIAKIGQLVLNKGQWDSTQVVSEAWIDDMLSEKSSVPDNKNLKFGYYWWLHPSKNYQFMWGHGGQYVFLIPDKNALVVITSIEQLASEHAVWIDEAISIVDAINNTLN